MAGPIDEPEGLGLAIEDGQGYDFCSFEAVDTIKHKATAKIKEYTTQSHTG